MDLPGRSGHDGSADGSPGVPGVLAVFTPMVLADCLGWVRITVPQANARAACLAVSAHIHLMRPEIPLRDLDARAETAIRALEGGADSVAVIDDRHRVDRTGPCLAAGLAAECVNAGPDGRAAGPRPGTFPHLAP